MSIQKIHCPAPGQRRCFDMVFFGLVVREAASGTGEYFDLEFFRECLSCYFDLDD